MDAAGIALQSEIQVFSSRLQLRLLAAATFFLAMWGGIVLLAIALPPHLRIPVLAAVIVGVRDSRRLGALRREARGVLARRGLDDAGSSTT